MGSGIKKVDRGRSGCLFSAGRLPRHSALNETVRRSLASAAIPAILKPTDLVRNVGPDGKSVVPWHLGKTLAWEMAVVDIMAQSHLKEGFCRC